jgi:GNAT superfamily N-acetyltransferase
MDTAVRRATPADRLRLATALADAFYDDPFATYIWPGDATRRARLASFQRMMLRAQMAQGEVWTVDGAVAGAMWGPPRGWQLARRTQLRMLPRMLWLTGSRAGVAGAAVKEIEHHHPKDVHWYLAVLGTEPAMQGRGLGSALLQPVLERADRDDVPAYLESSKATNIPFYARHGFEVTGEIRIPDGPSLWPMWREPRR